MADFLVDRAITLERFLRSQSIQAWRVPVLVDQGGVRVLRDRNVVQLKGVGTQLKEGDLVRVLDPLPQAVVKALQAAADKNATDYAFVPGTSDFDKRMAELIDLRPQTIRITDPMIDSLKSFIASLGRGSVVVTPIRHIVIGSHANPEGYLFMKLDILAAKRIEFKDLLDAVRSKSLVVEPAWLEPRPRDANGAPIPAQFLVRGCRIGQVPVYLRKLKEAVGNKLPVVAPKHFHNAAIQSKPAGRAEYMSYGFVITRPKPLRNKAAVVAEFAAGGFTRIDGSPVPAKSWSEWVPKNPHAANQQEVDAKVQNPITNAGDTIPGYFRFRRREYFDGEQSFGLEKDPGDLTGRKNAIRAELEKAHPEFLPAYEFPEYLRLGYESMAEFMDGFTWKVRYDKSTKTLFFSASRAEYTVIRPIVDVASNRLILNYYPSATKGTALEQLNVTDKRLFETV